MYHSHSYYNFIINDGLPICRDLLLKLSIYIINVHCIFKSLCQINIKKICQIANKTTRITFVQLFLQHSAYIGYPCQRHVYGKIKNDDRELLIAE